MSRYSPPPAASAAQPPAPDRPAAGRGRLGLFTATGTLKALAVGVPPVGACLIGMLTAIGGGLARDLLTGEIPVVLQRDIYAIVAVGGAILVTIFHRAGLAGPFPPAIAALLTTGLRLLAPYRRWSASGAVP